ncbi:MAG: hypothetical protein ACFFAO_08740 [Candidatus Hermodarchaeota archaeon]
MDEIIVYFLFGGVVFLFIFVLLFYISKKFKKILKKQYLPETASSFKCLDGHIVKSKGELIIDNFLYTNGIDHIYENTIKVKGSSIKYDWYLPGYEIYIEYWGYYGKEYMNRKEEKIKLYKQGKLSLISIEDVMFTDIYSNLKDSLRKYITFDKTSKHCPNCGTVLDNRF